MVKNIRPLHQHPFMNKRLTEKSKMGKNRALSNSPLLERILRSLDPLNRRVSSSREEALSLYPSLFYEIIYFSEYTGTRTERATFSRSFPDTGFSSAATYLSESERAHTADPNLSSYSFSPPTGHSKLLNNNGLPVEKNVLCGIILESFDHGAP